MAKEWSRNSWKEYKIVQQPEYQNIDLFNSILKKIESYPPMVFSGEIQNLKKQIAEAGDGRRFILQGGDCAERFIDCNDRVIINKIKILLQMSVILTYGVRKPIVRIGRIAGQFSKPRSNLTEVVNNETLMNYRGDSINSFDAVKESRIPDPKRLEMAFFYSVSTLNYIRAIIAGGFADLHHPYNWNLNSFERTREWEKYRDTVDKILDAIDFMESFGGLKSESLGAIDFFISHEGLLLDYETALTRKDPDSGLYYNHGAHMLWIGERTRALDGAHVEYFRGISNPIGIKIGHKIDKDELLELINRLNPENLEGRITLITRMGIDNVEGHLPVLVKSVVKSRRNVTWSCDPMHGNIINSTGNKKTRNFNHIISEIKHTFRIHNENRSNIGGVHFELTGEDVNECIGGAVDLKDRDLNENYETYCDPRLNYSQSMEIAFLISELLS